jgi:hypothetical protein
MELDVTDNILHQTLFLSKITVAGLVREFFSVKECNENGDLFDKTGRHYVNLMTKFKIPECYEEYSRQFQTGRPRKDETESQYAFLIMEQMASRLMTDIDKTFDVKLKTVHAADPNTLGNTVSCVNALKLHLCMSLQEDPLSSFPEFIKTQLGVIWGKSDIAAAATKRLTEARKLKAEENIRCMLQALDAQARARAEASDPAQGGYVHPLVNSQSQSSPRAEETLSPRAEETSGPAPSSWTRSRPNPYGYTP